LYKRDPGIEQLPDNGTDTDDCSHPQTVSRYQHIYDNWLDSLGIHIYVFSFATKV